MVQERQCLATGEPTPMRVRIPSRPPGNDRDRSSNQSERQAVNLEAAGASPAGPVFRARSSAARASALQAESREFESLRAHHTALSYNGSTSGSGPQGRGSIPCRATIMIIGP